MHRFLKAIGFSNIKKEEWKQFLEEAAKNPDSHEVALDSEGSEYVELSVEVCRNIGIAMRGTYDETDTFHLDYEYPYFIGNPVSSDADVEIIRQSDRESYQGVCDDIRLGVNLIFYLQNMMEYLQKSKSANQGEIRGVCLAGLATEGKILLPMMKTEKETSNIGKYGNDRSSLVAAARDGDEDAIENLTLEDMDTYSMLSKRVGKEDILTIVSSYFMPYGIESDKYSVLGEIVDVKRCANQITMEEICVMTLDCNDIVFEICINRNDLLGEPEIGRRFKGVIWMQGNVEFGN